MKNTKMRKKMLISSIAMLMVATVSLGSATYAWFTSSTEAYADGIYVRTTKVSNLEISSKLTNWTTHIDYNVGDSDTLRKLMPASTADGTNWYTADATDGTSFASATAEKINDAPTALTNVCDYYFADQLNIQNAGQATCKGVTITMTKSGAADLSDYARVAIVPVAQDHTTISPLTEGGSTNWYDYILDTQGETYNAAKGTELMKEDTTSQEDPKPWIVNNAAVQSVTASSTWTITVGDMAPEDIKYFNVYIWFEGQDKDCKNANSGQPIPGVTFTVNGNADSTGA